MKYLLTIYGNDTVWDELTPDDIRRRDEGHAALIDELVGTGEWIATSRLGLAAGEARVVRTDTGAPLVTDGPFTEGREIAGGLYLVECADIARASEIAARLTEAEYAPIDVRLLVDGEGGNGRMLHPATPGFPPAGQRSILTPGSEEPS